MKYALDPGKKMRPVGKASSAGNTTDWKRLRSLGDKDIRLALDKDPEIRPTDANFWKKAKVVRTSIEAQRS